MARQWRVIAVWLLKVKPEHVKLLNTVHGETVITRRHEVREVQLNRCYLRLPLAALGLGRQIVLRVPGSRQRTYPMHVPFRSDQLA